MRPYATTVKFLTSQHIDLTPHTQRNPTDRNNTLHPETIYNRYQTSPIFASDGSYSSVTQRTGAGIALLALDHPLAFTPNLTDQAWHNSFTTPLLFASHLLPPKIGTTQTDVNHGEAHALALALMHAPKTYPSLFILDSKHVFRFIIKHFTSHTTTNRNTVRNIHPSITTFYSGIITILLQHHHLSPPAYTASPIDLAHEELLRQLSGDLHQPCVDLIHLDTSTLNTSRRLKTQSTTTDAPSTSWEDTISFFRVNHQAFLHINSHQLTDTGHHKNGIPHPIPNYAICSANAWADYAAKLPTRHPPPSTNSSTIFPMHKSPVPQPPILAQQYMLTHNKEHITGPTTPHIKHVFITDLLHRFRSHPEGWLTHHWTDLQHAITRYDINYTHHFLLTNTTHSHTRMLESTPYYHHTYHTRHHPLQQYQIRTITTQMKACPLCDPHRPPIPPTQLFPLGTAFHLHNICSNPTLSHRRYQLNRTISQHLKAIETLTTFINTILRPLPEHYEPPAPFSAFLRSQIDLAHKAEPRSPYASTVLPRITRTTDTPTITNGYWYHHPSLYHYIDHYQNIQPTSAHQAGLVPATSDNTSILTHTIIDRLSMTGILPHHLHSEIRGYFNYLNTAFDHQHPNLNNNNPLDKLHRTYAPLSTPHSAAIRLTLTHFQPPYPATIYDACIQLWDKLNRSLLNKPIQLQQCILNLLNKTRKYTASRANAPAPQPTPIPQSQSQPTNTTASLPTRSLCQHPRCTHLHSQGHRRNPHTHTCIPCKGFDLAINWITQLEKHLVRSPQTLSHILQLIPSYRHLHLPPLHFATNLHTTPPTIPLSLLQSIHSSIPPQSQIHNNYFQLPLLPRTSTHTLTHQATRLILSPSNCCTAWICCGPTTTHLHMVSCRRPLTTVCDRCARLPRISGKSHLALPKKRSAGHSAPP